MEKYQELYNIFIDKYMRTEVTPSEVGEVLSRIAGLFPNYNMSMVKAEHIFAIVHKNVAEKTDETTGKNISSSKAEVLADASPEALEFKVARGHVTNIEMLIGSLKFLQKSLEVEYQNSSL